jgi:hypothetical protein
VGCSNISPTLCVVIGCVQVKLDAARERIRVARRARRLARHRAELDRAHAQSAQPQRTDADDVDGSASDQKVEAGATQSGASAADDKGRRTVHFATELPDIDETKEEAHVEAKEPETEEELDVEWPGWRDSPAVDKVVEICTHVNCYVR